MSLAPPPVTESQDSFAWQQWYIALTAYVAGSGTIPWATIDFTASDLSDIVTRTHNTLQTIQGGTTGEYYHFTDAEHTALQARTGIFSFSTLVVAGQSDVVADAVADSLTLVAGSNVTITTNAGADSITIASAVPNVFGTIAVSGQSDVVADSSTDTLTLVAGTNVTITTDAGTDSVTINASGGNAFGTVVVAGQSDVVADAGSDSLTLVAGSNITLTTNAGTDTITIASAAGGGTGTTLGLVVAVKDGVIL